MELDEILDFAKDKGFGYERLPIGEDVCIFADRDGGYIRISDSGDLLYSVNVSGRSIGFINKYGIKILLDLYFNNRGVDYIWNT